MIVCLWRLKMGQYEFETVVEEAVGVLEENCGEVKWR